MFLYGSYYLAGILNEKPLVDAARRPAPRSAWRAPRRCAETEDHIASLCEVMRYLIAGDDVAVCNLEQQRRFFRAHLQPWVERCATRSRRIRAPISIARWPRFTRAFVAVETQGFDLLDA